MEQKTAAEKNAAEEERRRKALRSASPGKKHPDEPSSPYKRNERRLASPTRKAESPRKAAEAISPKTNVTEGPTRSLPECMLPGTKSPAELPETGPPVAEVTSPKGGRKKRTTEGDPASPRKEEPASHKKEAVKSYRGFTEHAYRLVFDYQDKYKSTPHLITLLPDGTIETEKDLESKKDKGVIAYAFPQTTTEDVARKHTGTPYVWKRDDGSYAVVQAWVTNYNDTFRAEYTCNTKNPDTDVFIPQAAEEFKKMVEKLFGKKSKNHDVLYCHRKTTNVQPLHVGTAAALQSFLRENRKIVQDLDIIELTENGFVCRTINGNKQEDKKDFQFGDRDTMYALYTKQGWDTMACITPWDQFQKNRDIAESMDALKEIANRADGSPRSGPVTSPRSGSPKAKEEPQDLSAFKKKGGSPTRKSKGGEPTNRMPKGSPTRNAEPESPKADPPKEEPEPPKVHSPKAQAASPKAEAGPSAGSRKKSSPTRKAEPESPKADPPKEEPEPPKVHSPKAQAASPKAEAGPSAGSRKKSESPGRKSPAPKAPQGKPKAKPKAAAPGDQQADGAAGTDDGGCSTM